MELAVHSQTQPSDNQLKRQQRTEWVAHFSEPSAFEPASGERRCDLVGFPINKNDFRRCLGWSGQILEAVVVIRMVDVCELLNVFDN